MEISKLALNLTIENINKIENAKNQVSNKRNVVYKENGKLNYLIQDNMKIKSFDNLKNKRNDVIEKFKNDETKTHLKL